MTATRIDKILLALGALLILISSYQLFFAGSERDSGPKLGTLTSALSIVKTKSAVALDWRDASQGLDVSDNQLIYTDNASSAEVKFLEGNSLAIGENSLVKLTAQGNEQGMDVSRGFIRARLEGNKSLKVQMNGEDYVLTGKDADIQINIQESKGEIGVISGEVKLEGDGVSESLTPQDALEIRGEKITKKKIHFQLTSPVQGSIRYALNVPSDVIFAWEPLEEGNLFISDRQDMKNAAPLKALSGVTVPLSQGLWYYKVENDNGPSLTGSFRIIKEVPLKVIRPANGAEISIPHDKLLLQWETGFAKRFLLEWNDGEVHSREVANGSAEVTVNPAAPFSWRVKILDEQRPQAVWTEWQSVNVKFIPVPAVPTELSPHEVEFQTYEKPQEKINLEWQGSGKFEVEIQDPQGTSDVRKVASTFSTYEATKAGAYKWRVKGYDDYLRSSEWSDWKTFVIQDLSEEVETSGVQRIQLKKPDQSVTFNWQAEAGSTSVFELSKDASFKTIVKKTEVSRDSIQVNVPETGSYYWRSRQYKPDGTFEVGQPKKVIIEPVPAPDKPEKLPDMKFEIQDEPVTSSFLEKIFNFIIPSAIADELKGTVKITLPVKEEAKKYIVRIYRDQDLTDLAYETSLSDKEFEWVNATPGKYYWQYAVIDYWDRQSLFSDPSELTVSGVVTPLPEKPRLLTPVRAKEIDQKDLILKWTHSPLNVNYKAEISETRDFKKVVSVKETKINEASFTELKLTPSLHYWRVVAFNKKNKSVESNTGRFTILPPLEKTIITDFPSEYVKEWKSRAFIAWAPSMDSYTFKDVETGKIDGNTMMSVLLSGTVFKENYVLNGELLRQTGEVFEGEKYLFQRLLIDGLYLFGKNPRHKWGGGIALGQTSSQAYAIENGEVKSSSVSGLVYGPVVRNYLVINELWEMQGRAQYLLGEVTQMDLGADAIRKVGSFSVLGGISYSSREYELNSGKQTSLKISLGIGTEF